MSDPIADMATRIRNAQMVDHSSVSMPSSKVKVAIAAVLKSEGYIEDFSVEGDLKKTLSIKLKHFAGRPVIEEIRRISRPGLRNYVQVSDMKPAKNGLGVYIVSTSKGIMTAHEAKKLNVGGEMLLMVA